MNQNLDLVGCKKCNHSPMVLRLTNDFYFYKEEKLELSDLPIYVCPKCNNKFYPDIYKFKRIKQIKEKVSKLINYEKYLTSQALIEIRMKLGLTHDQMDSLIAAKFGQFAQWEKETQKIPAVYNLLLKLIKKELDSGQSISIIESLKHESQWWKG